MGGTPELWGARIGELSLPRAAQLFPIAFAAQHLDPKLRLFVQPCYSGIMSRNAPQKHELAVVNDAGDIELIDLLTGELIVNNRGVEATSPHQYAFSYEKAIMICQKIKEGKTLNEISLEPWAPPLHVISHWQRTDKMFAEEMKLARVARAEYHHEVLLDTAKKALDGTYDKDSVPGIKMGLDTLKWSAERANPERYGNKVTHEGSTEKPIIMRVINTGINRAPKQEIVEAEHKEIPNGKTEATRSEPVSARSIISTGIQRAQSSHETEDEVGEGESH
jgi:hypothetical protein